MKLAIHEDRIEVTNVRHYPEINWKAALDELNAEHLPGLYRHGQRMCVSVIDGRMHAHIYRTNKMPAESKIREIFKRYGIE
jgi:hypothetical protein